ncbi:NAD(P)/FAD-dependent oxidoreductase [Amycolatopsis sp.]|uniref:NAD(P)/FAD-dependent oxidoreductase n=1 Tax=Amycolatopsis sp. TaxID=37632 RepID=UPI002CC7D647|nr:FAD-dependent oxidoreductase [Amycolatopsis sp.]HVV08032.1 FAD-dependent oxidoreductase [Amycolatopsis sp.]
MTLVVVGASLAGLRAVEAARQAGFTGRIVLIGAEEHLPYDRPPLSKAFLEDAEPTVPTYRTGQALREDLGVELMLGTAATGLDVAGRAVLVGGQAVRYDGLVLATGAAARKSPLPGVRTLRTLDDAIAVREALDAGARTVVIGAGFIGSEIASGARARGLDVTVVEALPTPLVRAVGAQMGEICADLHRRNGTGLRCGVQVTSFDEGRVTLSDGVVLPADLVVAGVGAVPATGWLEGSGLTLDDGVVCDETLRAGPGIYAAGDVARWHNPAFGRSMRLEHWTSAAEQARVAARNAIDPAGAAVCRVVPYFWSDWYGDRIQFAGVPAADEVRVVDDGPGRLVALYREGGRLAGALTLNGRAKVMKYRGLIQRGASWAEGLAFAAAGKNVNVDKGGVPV